MYGVFFIVFKTALNSAFEWQLWWIGEFVDNFGTVKLDWKILKEAKEWTYLLEVWHFERADIHPENSKMLDSGTSVY